MNNQILDIIEIPFRIASGVVILASVLFSFKMLFLGGGITFWDLIFPPIVATFHISRGISIYFSISIGTAFFTLILSGFTLGLLITYTCNGRKMFNN